MSYREMQGRTVAVIAAPLLFLLLSWTSTAARAAETGGADFTSTLCFKQNEAGSASCSAVCPDGQFVLHCSYNLGNYSSGDTCTSISRVMATAAAQGGDVMSHPHTQCDFSVVCSDPSGTLTLQGFATCYTP